MVSPFVLAIEAAAPLTPFSQCFTCGKFSNSLVKCLGGCGSVLYCSSQCQELDRSRHRQNCRVVGEAVVFARKTNVYGHLIRAAVTWAKRLVEEGNADSRHPNRYALRLALQLILAFVDKFNGRDPERLRPLLPYLLICLEMYKEAYGFLKYMLVNDDNNNIGHGVMCSDIPTYSNVAPLENPDTFLNDFPRHDVDTIIVETKNAIGTRNMEDSVGCIPDMMFPTDVKDLLGTFFTRDIDTNRLGKKKAMRILDIALIKLILYRYLTNLKLVEDNLLQNRDAMILIAEYTNIPKEWTDVDPVELIDQAKDLLQYVGWHYCRRILDQSRSRLELHDSFLLLWRNDAFALQFVRDQFEQEY